MDQQLVTVAKLDSPEKAALAQNMLEAAGIPCFLEGEHTGAAWTLGGTLGQVKLLVADEDADEAIALLNKEELPAPLDAIQPAPRAPLSADVPPTAFAHGPPPYRPAYDEDEPEIPPTLREKNARAAFFTGILGLAVWPLLFLAYWLIIQVATSQERLEGKYRRQAWIASFVLIGLPVLLAVLLFSGILDLSGSPRSLSHPPNVEGRWQGIGPFEEKVEMDLKRNGNLSFRAQTAKGVLEFTGVWGLDEDRDEFHFRIETHQRGKFRQEGRTFRWLVTHSRPNELELQTESGGFYSFDRK